VPTGPRNVSQSDPACAEQSILNARKGQHKRSLFTKCTTTSNAVASNRNAYPSTTSRCSRILGEEPAKPCKVTGPSLPRLSRRERTRAVTTFPSHVPNYLQYGSSPEIVPELASRDACSRVDSRNAFSPTRRDWPTEGAQVTTAVLHSLLTCPHCGFAEEMVMPLDACLFFHECAACHVVVRPGAGHCCVFCSYGSVPCPSMQSAESCCLPTPEPPLS
jgi:hypothetical protein